MAIDDSCLAAAEARARANYSAPGRFYHDQSHLDDCLRQLESIDGLSKRERRLLRWAILWHDVIYDPPRSDNEELSAERARRELVNCGVASADADEVARLILLTKSHRAEATDRLGALLVSIDLSILGSEPERYRAYSEAVHKEYAHLPDEAWRSGRAAVLESLLSADQLYPEPRFRAALGERARRNMNAELKALSAG
jgi:predicted metal-dependent HD superfamily phosphohydrolase